MDVRLLGPFEAREGERALQLGGRKQRAVLAVLALSAGRTVSTERLVDELWGDDVPETAVKMVQIYVSQLRKVLPSGVLVTRPPGYALDVEDDAVDLRRFESLLAQGRSHLERGDAARAAELLREALALWRGPALQEFAGEPFGRVEIPRLEELQVAALEERVDADLALGRHADLVGELESLVVRHPLRERLRGQQLLALYRSGRQADALASYHAFRRMLDDELGIDPSARLRELERLILRQDPALDAPVTPSRGAAPRARSEAAPGVEPVGRDEELRQLHDELAQALGGARRLVLVSGEAGIGKSTLVDAFLAQAEAAGPLLVARGLCLDQHGPAEPYLPVLDALGRLCSGPRGDEVVEVLLRSAPTWLAQMPWFVEREDLEALDHAVLGATPERMLRELGQALEAVAELSPLVLVLEDLQWSDAATVDALAWLARRDRPAPLLLVGTTTSGNGGPTALAALVDELRVRRRCTGIALAGLDADALTALVAHRTGPGELSERLGSLLLERTSGNPLFAQTVLDGWIADGTLVGEEGDRRLAGALDELATAVPESIRAVVLRQLEQLEGDEQELLEAVCVAGKEAATVVVAAALQRSEHEVDLACVRLVRRGRFLRLLDPAEWPDGTVTGRFAFLHEVHRQVLYEHVPPARRARLHRLIADRLEQSYGERRMEVAAELAYHYQRGFEPERAVRCLRLAAELALRRLAPRPATGLLRSALQTLPDLPEGTERDRLELDLLVLLGQALIVADGWAAPEAEETLDRARLLGTRLADNEPIVPVLVALGTIYEVRGDFEQAERVGRECLRVVPEAAGDRRLQAHEVLACSLFHQGSFSRALEEAELGAALADLDVEEDADVVVFGDDIGVACHDWAALALWFLGRPESARARAEAAIRLAEHPRRAYGLAAAHVQAAIVHHCRGDAAAARAAAARTVELADARGYAYRAALGSALHGWARVAGGEPEGLVEVRDGIDAARATGVRMDEPYLLGLLADASIRLGRHGDAAAALEEALAGPSFYEAELLRLRAAVEAARGSPAAEATLAEALERAHRQEARSPALRVAVDLAALLAAAGRADEARAVLHDARDRVSERSADTEAADALLARLAAGGEARAPRAHPPVESVEVDGIRLAYQVTGSGPLDIVLVPGFLAHLELDWEEPGYARFLERLGRNGRLIRFDQRGTGLSDRTASVPDLETRMDDLLAVLGAAGSERAALVGLSEGVSTAILLAASHPERVQALVLYGGFAQRLGPDDDYPWAPTREERAAYVDRVVAEGGHEWDLRLLSPSADDALAAWWVARARAAALPEDARRLLELTSQIDVRDVLPALHVPTLVVHRGSGYVLPEESRYLAARIPGARLVELAGADHVVNVDPDAILDVVEPFLLEAGGAAAAGESRVLATILVTDLVGSTATLSRLGDAAWSELLGRHHDAVRAELARFAGVEVDTAGDGFLASFDGPGRAIRCGIALQQRLAGLGLAVRIGVHTGEVERRGAGVSGIAVHTASRVAAEAVAGEVLVTATTRDLVAGAGFAFTDRGERELRGLGEPRRLYAVVDGVSAAG